jgi:hypothetical protein
MNIAEQQYWFEKFQTLRGLLNIQLRHVTHTVLLRALLLLSTRLCEVAGVSNWCLSSRV